MDRYLGLIKEQSQLYNIKVYIVGGAVRNDLLGIPINDYDFVLNGDCHEFAIKIANILNGSYVNMHENVARVVCSEIVFDFCSLNGNTLYDDLGRRDFTINSIAKDLSSGTIIDVNNGCLDIKNKVIRYNSEGVLDDDPLRMLRAVRLSSQLGFTICADTEELIKQKAELLSKTPGERILEEIYKILESKESYKYIEVLNVLGLLDIVFPIMKRMKNIGKCRYHVADAYTHSLLTLKYLDNNINNIIGSSYGNEIKKHIESDINGKMRIYTIKLAAFLHDIGKPDAMHIDGEKTSFHEHELTGESVFREISSRLSMSSKQKEIIISVIKGHMRVLGLFKQEVTDRAVYRLFRNLGDNVIDVLICSLCDICATRDLLENNGESEKYWHFIMSLISRYYTSANKQKLISGKDVIDITGASGGVIGKILKKVDEQYFYGNIKTRQQALDYIMSINNDDEV